MSIVLYSVDKELLYPLFVSVLQSSQNINSVNFLKKKFIYLAVLGLGFSTWDLVLWHTDPL